MQSERMRMSWVSPKKNTVLGNSLWNYIRRGDNREYVTETKALMKRFGAQYAKIGGRKASDYDFVKFLLSQETVLWEGVRAFIAELRPKVEEMRTFWGNKTNSDEWQHVAWHDERWFTTSPYYHLHMLHSAENNVANVAFCESRAKFEADRYTSCKPGRYLTRFFSDVLTENEIREWAERQASRALPAELKFIEHDDKKGWLRVYQDGPHSCMQDMDCVHVYAHSKSVLRLAYLQQGAHQILARAIVREDTTPKEYVRVYPNTDESQNQLWHTRMKSALEAEGYVHGNLRDVLLEKSEYSGENDSYEMPYLDYGNSRRGEYTNVDEVHLDGRDYFQVASDGNYCAQSTTGYITVREKMRCDICGDHVDPDETTYIEGYGDICNHCVDSHFVMAWISRREQEYVHQDDDNIIYCPDTGDWYTQDATSLHDIYECQYSNKWYKLDNLVTTSAGLVHISHATALDEPDPDGENWALDDDAVHTNDGRMIHKDCAKEIDGEVYHVDDEVETDKEEKTNE